MKDLLSISIVIRTRLTYRLVVIIAPEVLGNSEVGAIVFVLGVQVTRIGLH